MKKIIIVLLIIISTSFVGCSQNVVEDNNTIPNSVTSEKEMVTPIVKEKVQYYANKIVEVFNGKDLSKSESDELNGYIEKYWKNSDWNKNEFSFTEKDKLLITQLFMSYDKMKTYVFLRDENKMEQYKNSKSIVQENEKLMQICKEEATVYLNKILASK